MKKKNRSNSKESLKNYEKKKLINKFDSDSNGKIK